MQSPPSARILWVDVLKGVAIIMVVLQHLASRFDAELNPNGWGFWTDFSQFFIPLRMPLFFFLSGFVVANAVTRGTPVLRKRILGPLYLYLLWTTLFSVRLVPAAMTGWVEDLRLGHFLTSLLLPTTFWYIYALAAYFAMCFIVARLGPAVRVMMAVVALGLSFGAAFFPEFGRDLLAYPWSLPQLPAMVANFVWFYVGVFGRDAWLRLAARPRPAHAAILTFLYIGAYWASRATGVAAVVEPLLSAVGLLALAMVCGRISCVPKIRWITYIGQHTLPVYIFHIAFISVAFEVIARSPLAAAYANDPGGLSLISVPATTVLFIAASLALEQRVLHSRIAFLLVPPSWVTGGTRTPPPGAENKTPSRNSSNNRPSSRGSDVSDPGRGS